MRSCWFARRPLRSLEWPGTHRNSRGESARGAAGIFQKWALFTKVPQKFVRIRAVGAESGFCHFRQRVTFLMSKQAPLLPSNTGCSPVAHAVGNILGRVADLNASLPTPVSVFTSASVPMVGIGPFVNYVVENSMASDAAVLFSLIYTDRLSTKDAAIILTPLSVHRVWLAAIVVAVKFVDDRYLRLRDFAVLGGVCASELARLELIFLFRLSFHMMVSPSEYEVYAARLESHMSGEVQLSLLPPTPVRRRKLKYKSTSAMAHSLTDGSATEDSASMMDVDEVGMEDDDGDSIMVG